MKLRTYQETICAAQRKFLFNSNTLRAQIYSPTGSGKTVCFTELIKEAFAKGMSNILVVHPRIALSEDQQQRLAHTLGSAEFASFHSGSVRQTDGERVNHATTNRNDLLERIDTRTGNHITFSSYKSLHKIADIKFDLIICDEAHYLTQPEFAPILNAFVSKVLFYTATPIEIASADGDNTPGGMCDVAAFGAVICEVRPKDLIDRGYVVAPRLRFLDVSVQGDSEFADPADTIAHAFVDQRTQLNPNLVPKMLVAMSSTLMFDDIMAELRSIREIAGSDVDVYYVTADNQKKNGVPVPSRRGLLADVAATTSPSIIIHCDTLAEGIDIDGLSGAFIFRTLSKTKFLQTIGRAARPFKRDLDDEGEVIDFANRIKPNCIITIPTINGQLYGNTNAQYLCEVFTSAGYGDIIDLVDQPGELVGSKGDDIFDDWADPPTHAIAEIVDVRVREEALNVYRFLLDGVTTQPNQSTQPV